MLRTTSHPTLRMIWRGRQPFNIHPRVLFSVRQHLSVLHAAVDLQDIQQAFGDRLHPCHFVSNTAAPDGPSDDAEPNGYRVDIGYGWWMEFRLIDGEAVQVDLTCDYDSKFGTRYRPPRLHGPYSSPESWGLEAEPQ